MHLDKRTRIQLAILSIVTLVAGAVMIFGYIKIPALLGVGRYTVTVELPRTAGIYATSNVTYRGTKVGRVTDVYLTDTGAAAVLSLQSDVDIPSDVDAAVHSATSMGELYIALTPRDGAAAPLKDGDVIPVERSTVPPDINNIVEATNRGLQAIPKDNLKVTIDESYTAIGGLGPELAKFVQGATAIAREARENLDGLTTLIDSAQPVLDSQAESADSIHAWAANLRTAASQLQTNDSAVAGILQHGPAAAEETRQLLDRMQPTLPVLLANLVTVTDVALAYQPNIEQLLVLVPQLVQELQGILVAGHGVKQDYRGAYLSFNLNLNLPPVCSTGYLPAQQRRSAVSVDHPDPPDGDVFCRIPQDSTLVGVRGVRNTPCATVPGKRAPTVDICESDDQYVPLNDGMNWKGDPNATLSGQDIPHRSPGPQPGGPPPSPDTPTGTPLPPLVVAEYDPATGNYMGPDGKIYTHPNLASEPKEQTWQSMLTPAPLN